MSSVADGVRAAQLRLPRRAYGWAESARLTHRKGRIAVPDIAGWVGQVPDAAHRLLFAPAGSAGQGYRWARAAEAHLDGVSAQAWMFTTGSSYAFPADVTAPAAVSALGKTWQRDLFDAVAATFTHVILESGRPLFGGLFGHDSAREAAALRAAGLGVAMVWHGTDIRLPSAERATNPHSPFRDPGHRATLSLLEARARRNANLAAASGIPQLFSTPDLAAHVPGGTWLPVAVDAQAWRLPAPAPHGGPLAVLFQPSQAWIKGVPQVEPVLSELAQAGVITRVPSTRVSPAEVPALVARADVVLDQFRLDLYGVATAEAMLASRPVVALAGEPLRAAVRELTGEELPVVSSSVGELGATLTALAADAAARGELAERASDYALRWHDGRASAAALARALELA